MTDPWPALGPPIARPLSPLEVRVEANRCLSCYDAPCTRACPTGIDVPAFIGRIASGDMLGSARAIMDANPVGASCARVCPTSELCEGACVFAPDDSPIRIGDLQRHATDWAMRSSVRLFEAGTPTDKRVAVVGAGPAGLAAARDLARFGHEVTIFERDDQPGGLDTYGIVPFRLPAEIALWEAQQVRELGVTFRTGVSVGETIPAQDVLNGFDAVVLAVGMGDVAALGVAGEDTPGVWDALEFIRVAKTGGDVGTLGERVAVIGGGNTAIDAATSAGRLGASSVTMYYRRGEERMTAYDFEIAFAKLEGIEFRTHVLPSRILSENGRVRALELVATDAAGTAVPVPGTEHIVPIDTVIVAIGQTRRTALFDAFEVAYGPTGIARVDDRMQTTRAGVFAAGDCTFTPGGIDAMVVEAAQRGKIAACEVDAYLSGERP